MRTMFVFAFERDNEKQDAFITEVPTAENCN